jgi:actin-related protein 6
VLNLSNLTITVPELLFTPSDAGIKSAGIREAIVQTVQLLQKEIREELLGNIVVIGGVSETRGVCERIKREVRENVGVKVRVRKENEGE